MTRTMFCPRCGGPSAWTRPLAEPAGHGDAVHTAEAAISRTVCARCATAWDVWLADRRRPEAFVDVALAAPWRDALARFDHLGATANRTADVTGLRLRDTFVALPGTAALRA
ncbi:hypothetical protein [Cellulomonas rhizosphaerae]|nr:hypothetical protein [Cellulomonas rhizosphaerae]